MDLLERPIYGGETKTNLKVCGVIEDYIYAPLQYPVSKVFFRLHTDKDFADYYPIQYFYVRYTPGHKKEVLEHISKVTQKLNSLVSLSAQQRKKEIAIRKVNGATFYHILQLFFREYLILVVISNLFALPIGYILMKRWLETYANHIHLTIWPFIAVFFITCVIVLLSIFRQVKEAALANPAESVKSE